MATKSSTYWKGRFDQIEQSANNKSVKFTKQLDKKYKVAANEIDTKINAWYQRLADNNGVSVAEARKLLTNSELKEFKWTVQEYIKAGEENALDQRWMKELENASAKFHINRLEALKLECRQQVEMAMGTGQQAMFNTLADVYKDTFYHSCYEIQKGVGVGFDVSKLSDKQVQTVLSKPWSVDGTNFSTKVWNNKTKLINNLDQELSRMVMTGESPRQAIQNIRKSMDTSLYNAKRLVMTESAYFTTVGQQDAFEELDVEEYEIVATLDNKTSDICQEQDGKHYPVKDMMPGVNAPPFHVFCRSTTCPYFNDEFTVDDMRVAKNEETGEWYEVPADMTYPEWKKSFVDGGSKDELKSVKKDDTIKASKDKIQVVEKVEPVYKELTEEQFKAIKQPITKEERKIIYGKSHFSGYINSSNARKMNALMREGKELTPEYKDIELALKGVISRHKLPDDLIVTRYVNDDALENMFGVSAPTYKLSQKVDDFWEQVENLPNLIGSDKEYIEKGFLSTSGVADKNVMSNKNVKLIIKAPKDTPAYVTTNYKESEIIFGENTTLYLVNSYIENSRTSDWKIVLECEIR